MKFINYKIAVVVCGLILAVLVVWRVRERQEAMLLKDRWANVHVGMSKGEVKSLLGEPDDIYSAGSGQSNSLFGTMFDNWLFDSFLEKWAYGNRRTFDFQRQFPYIVFAMDGLMTPEANDYVIYFSKDGKVVKKKYPYKAK